MKTIYEHLTAAVKTKYLRSSQRCSVTGSRAKGTNKNTRNSLEIQLKHFLLSGWPNSGQVVEFPSLKILKNWWKVSWATCSRQPCSEQGSWTSTSSAFPPQPRWSPAPWNRWQAECSRTWIDCHWNKHRKALSHIGWYTWKKKAAFNDDILNLMMLNEAVLCKKDIFKIQFPSSHYKTL